MSLSNLLHEFARALKHNRTGILMAIGVQAVCLLLFTIFAVITLNLFAFLNSARNRLEIHTFISDDADPEELSRSLRQIAGIADVVPITKEQALAELKKDMGSAADVIDALGYNPLPASLRIRLAPGFAAPGNLAELERKISIVPGVTEVWSGRELLGRLERIFTVATAVDIALLVVIALAIVFIVFQSVEASIATRQKEIEIMRLVGASDTTVRAPFYFEGFVQGLAGGILAFVLVLILYQLALVYLPPPIFPTPVIAILNIVLGAGLGYLGADIALSRLVK